MRIDAIKRILDSLPPGAEVTLLQGHDDETNTEFELRDAAPGDYAQYEDSDAPSPLERAQRVSGTENAKGIDWAARETEAALNGRCDEDDAPYGLNNPGDEYPGGVL